MNVSEFVAKWRKAELTERSASQQHFLDLCEVFNHPKPALADPTGENFTFERGAAKHGGGQGWADVWKKGFFGWEYKGKHKDLVAAYDQLLKYREALENPPLLVVCDMDRFEIHTNFTATVSKTYQISLDDLDTPRNIEIIRNLFFDPTKLRPDATSEAITKEVAQRLAQIAQGLRQRGLEAMEVARFLDRIVFCLFAEDVGLLPRKLFSSIVEKSRDPVHFGKLIGQLFAAMNDGGDFGLETIRHFNGNLFTESAVLELTAAEINHVRAAARLDWSAVDPSIFGTLFQRGLDPDTRAQLGAQYTSREDIETLIEPVVMQPLRREWEEMRESLENLRRTGKAKPTGKEKPPTADSAKRGRREALSLFRNFHERLAHIKVLDPACGSGNFLYVTLQKLKDLEKEVLVYGGDNYLGSFLPQVGPWQFYGIEINPYAFELAQTTLWIGYLQWIQANGFGVPAEPILREMDNFRNMDAILNLSDPDDPKEPDWPEADFIVGNPPFLGNRFIAGEIGQDYVKGLAKIYQKRLGGKPDLVCYFFEKARKAIMEGRSQRAGLLATQGIRGGTNRNVLKRIKESGDIFFAVSDREWILDGANVHISMVGFDDGTEQRHVLNGEVVAAVHSNLTGETDTTIALVLQANAGISFQGSIKRGDFDIDDAQAAEILSISGNPHERPNSDVVVPYVNGMDLTKHYRNVWIIDFSNRKSELEVSMYVEPFKYVRRHVKPEVERTNQQRECWWIHWRSRPEMHKALKGLRRFIATPRVSKHRLFTWLEYPSYPDSALIVFAREDDYFFGLLHSRLHEVWALNQGTQLREKESGFRYTPTTCFETFPFPVPTVEQEAAIATAAKKLEALRTAWLNPPEWTREEILEFLGSVDGPWARYIYEQDERGIGTVRYPRLIPKGDEAAELLAKRTLTNLYNERPTWLDLAHRSLDEVVFAAYGWEPTLSDDEILARLLELNQQRAEEQALEKATREQPSGSDPGNPV
jgi:type II restriction/modification system DNA methylase subunit YeeA